MSRIRQYHQGICAGDIDVVKQFLKIYPDMINTRDSIGNTGLVNALKNKHSKISHLLIKNGADISAADEEGSTPMMLAAMNHDFSVCNVLARYKYENKFHDLCGCELIAQNRYTKTQFY